MQTLDRDFSKHLERQLSQVDGAEDRLQAIADLKTVIADLYAKLGGESLAFTDCEAGGAVAHVLRTSTQEVTTWAGAYAEFGPDFINAESDPLDYRWWRAILKTDNPRHWLEQARTRQLNAAQIRAEAGVKQHRKPPWYDGGGMVEAMDGGNLLFSPDMEIELKGQKRVQAKLREVEE